MPHRPGMTLQQSANPVRAVGVCSYIQVLELMLCIVRIRRVPAFDLLLNQLLALQSLQTNSRVIGGLFAFSKSSL